MKKYNIETVYNYINGEDITDFTLEELESNTNFMIDVINVSNDKNFYNFTEDNVKTDYRFVKFIINKFKEDENLITVVADTYIENQDNEQNYIELLIIMCNLIKDKNSKNYKKYKFLLEVNHKSKRLQIELGKLKITKNPMSIEIENEDEIPSEFKKEVITTQIDKTAIKNHFKRIKIKKPLN